MTDEQLSERLLQARGWFNMARGTLEKGSQHRLSHRDQLEAALEVLQKWQQAENRTADDADGGAA